MAEGKMKTANEETWADGIASLLEQNIRGVEIGVYSVALCGLAVAIRSVRPFSKFSRPNQIPKEFFRTHIQLNGTVTRLDFNPSPVLLFDHSPLLFSRFRKSGPYLPVKIDSVDISGNGLSWLQTIVVNQPVSVTLMSPEKNQVTSIVSVKGIDVAEHLVSLGFASVGGFNETLEKDKFYRNYYQSLLKRENRAESRGLGMWNDRQLSIYSKLIIKFEDLTTRLWNLR